MSNYFGSDGTGKKMYIVYAIDTAVQGFALDESEAIQLAKSEMGLPEVARYKVEQVGAKLPPAEVLDEPEEIELVEDEVTTLTEGVTIEDAAAEVADDLDELS